MRDNQGKPDYRYFYFDGFSALGHSVGRVQELDLAGPEKWTELRAALEALKDEIYLTYGHKVFDEVAKVSVFGAQKYEPFGWKGLKIEDITPSLYRHAAYVVQDLEATDDESGLLHAGHLLANVLMGIHVLNVQNMDQIADIKPDAQFWQDDDNEIWEWDLKEV